MSTRLPTVAIVEDDKHMAHIWLRKLTRSGFNVVGVYASARAAWQALRKNPPDALILDWELVPGPNGDWLLKQCVKHKLPTRILVVTCHDYGKVQTAALGLGAHGFLGKPVPQRPIGRRPGPRFRPHPPQLADLREHPLRPPNAQHPMSRLSPSSCPLSLTTNQS